MDRVGTINWNTFRSLIKDAHDTFNQDDITWRKSLGGLDRFGEDNLTERFQDITLKGLFKYNDFKVWPSNQTTPTGELDRETTALFFNLDYLGGLGYLNLQRQFVYNQAADRFIHRGIVYKSTADTLMSQAKDIPLLVMLVLEREEIETATNNR